MSIFAAGFAEEARYQCITLTSLKFINVQPACGRE